MNPEDNVYFVSSHPLKQAPVPQVRSETPDDHEDWSEVARVVPDSEEVLSRPSRSAPVPFSFSDSFDFCQDDETDQSKDIQFTILKETMEPTFQGFTHQLDSELAAMQPHKNAATVRPPS